MSENFDLQKSQRNIAQDYFPKCIVSVAPWTRKVRGGTRTMEPV